MKVIIAGSRDIKDIRTIEKAIKDSGIDINEITEIVSGDARGVDKLGEEFAKENGILVKKIKADWDNVGKSAGYRRNEEMAEYADRLVAVWDGKSKGTQHMINTMSEANKEVSVTNLDLIYGNQGKVKYFYGMQTFENSYTKFENGIKVGEEKSDFTKYYQFETKEMLEMWKSSDINEFQRDIDERYKRSSATGEEFSSHVNKGGSYSICKTEKKKGSNNMVLKEVPVDKTAVYLHISHPNEARKESYGIVIKFNNSSMMNQFYESRKDHFKDRMKKIEPGDKRVIVGTANYLMINGDKVPNLSITINAAFKNYSKLDPARNHFVYVSQKDGKKPKIFSFENRSLQHRFIKDVNLMSSKLNIKANMCSGFNSIVIDKMAKREVIKATVVNREKELDSYIYEKGIINKTKRTNIEIKAIVEKVRKNSSMAGLIKNIDMRRVDLKGIELKGLDLSGCDFSGVDLSGMDLSGIKGKSVNFSNTKLNETNFEGSQLSSPKFTGSKSQIEKPVSFKNADLMKADFAYSNHIGANFNGSMMMECNVYDAEMQESNFEGAKLKDCRFNNTKLTGSEFDRELKGYETSSFHMANISMTNLEETKLDPSWKDQYDSHYTKTEAKLKDADVTAKRFSKKVEYTM